MVINNNNLKISNVYFDNEFIITPSLDCKITIIDL